MPDKCLIYACPNRAELCGYCQEHYERDITPYESLTKQQLADFIESVQSILSEFGLSLPKALVSGSMDTLSKADLRGIYRETKRHLDTELRHRLLEAPLVSNYRDLLEPEGYLWQRWERLCIVVATALFGDLLLHPRLPNDAVPDIVPRLDGMTTEHAKSGSTYLPYAPVIVELKQSLLHPEVTCKYGAYGGRIEVWFYRWRPHWLIHREECVVYQSPVDLARRLEAASRGELASTLRSLPLLWRTYELLPHYLKGIGGGS
jgi:hypothetical protein